MRGEFKVCKFTTEAITTEGSDKGELRRVCSNPACPIHHPQKQTNRDDGKWKAEQEKHRREEAIANATGLCVLAAISAAIPVRQMKRDLLFMAERVASLLDQNRLTVLARQYGIKKAKDNDSIETLFVAYLHRTDESALGRLLVEGTILLSASSNNTSQVLHDAAKVYKVDTDAIALRVKQEFAAKEKARKAVRREPRPTTKLKKAA
jgi:ParB family chromosome partitioning protein